MSKKYQRPGPTFWQLRIGGPGRGEGFKARKEFDAPLNSCERQWNQSHVGTMVRKKSTVRGAGPAPAKLLRVDASGIRCDRTLLGVPIVLICGGVAEEQALRRASVGWEGERDPTAAALTIELRCRGSLSESGSLEFGVSGSQMTLRGNGVDAVADAAERAAECTLSPDWLTRPADLLALVLEPLALFLATHSGRVPIHASAIRIGDLAILFAGPSGAGKSSLALAAHRMGLAVLSEDTVYVRPGPNPAIWGWNGPIHLLPGDVGPTAAPLRIRNGRAKHAISFENATSSSEPVNSAVVCILQRSAVPTLARLTTRSALNLLGPLEPGFDLLASAVHAVHRQLCWKGAWLLGLSQSPDEAISLVSENLDGLRRSVNERRQVEN